MIGRPDSVLDVGVRLMVDIVIDHVTKKFGDWFLGNPGMNFVPAQPSDAGVSSIILKKAMSLPSGLENKDLKIGIRPESVDISDEVGGDRIAGTLIDRTIAIAGYHLIRIQIGDQEIKLKSNRLLKAERGREVGLAFPNDHLFLFTDGERVNWNDP